MIASPTFITDENGQAYQFMLYLAFNASMFELKLYNRSKKYRFNGKVLDAEKGLYYYVNELCKANICITAKCNRLTSPQLSEDCIIGYYDPRISLWYGVDPMAEKYPDYSAYTYTNNNPIRFIDPDGQDWYEDENCNIRYDEKLTKSNQGEILKTGQRYLGETHSEKTKNGTNNYRKDGSALFGSQADGVKYMMWATTKDGDSGGKQKEQFAFTKENTMLVVPDKYNTSMRSCPETAGYNIYNCVFCDPVSNSNKNFNATVHNHSVGNYTSGEYPPSDLEFQFTKTPSKPVFVIGVDNGRGAGFGGNKRWEAIDHSSQKIIPGIGLTYGK